MDHDGCLSEQADQTNGSGQNNPAPVTGRAVVSDPPGAPSMLTLYAGDQVLAALELAPSEAVALASDLLLAARRRCGRDRQEASQIAAGDRQLPRSPPSPA